MKADLPPHADPHLAPLRAALDVQRAAWHANPMPTAAERRADLAQLMRFLKEQREAIVQAIAQDYGQRSPHETLIAEFVPALGALGHAQRHVGAWMRAQRRGIDRLAFGLARNEVIPQPLGVVGVIVPWNFPVNLSFGPLASILAAGNRAMVKMSENSRALAALLIERVPSYLPHDKLHFFDETGGVGVAFSQLPFDHLLFTGSGATGRMVMAAAAQNLVPVTLELGGKSPAIVGDDFDIRTAAERILYAKCLNAGQICVTVDHAYLPPAKVDAFIEAARAAVTRRYGTLASRDYSSIIDRRAYDRLREAMQDAQARGATLHPLLPGPAWDDAAHRIAPHIATNVPDDAQLMQREIFGPILPLLPCGSVDDAIDRINAGPRPLALYPFTHRDADIARILARTRSGGVSVNDAVLHVAQDDLPFGGVGASGMGHYHGHDGFLTFSKLRPVFRQSRWSTAALLAPPYGRRAQRVIDFLLR